MADNAPQARRKVMVSWSSGKDSAWTLWQLLQDPSVEVVGLLTTYNSEFDRVAIHGVRRQILQRQVELAGLPLLEVALPWPCSNADYEHAMEWALARAREYYYADTVAFGDLFLEDVRQYREQQFANSDLQPMFPLWGQPTDVLARQMIDAGLRASVSCLDPKQMPADLAGATFDHDLLDRLPSEVDPCGERGEFHTCVWAGPMFRRNLELIQGEVVERSGFVYADLCERTPNA
ncbi:ATP-binding protein [Porticoccaceae bacterium LTM1]|nr:ATP-binding protein [Porticoccaceae bacterium LTM1]